MLNNMNFLYTHTSDYPDGLDKTVSIDLDTSDATWMEVVSEFVSFLNACGYIIDLNSETLIECINEAREEKFNR